MNKNKANVQFYWAGVMCCTQLHLFVTHSLVAGGDLQFQESKKFKHNIYHLKGNSGIFKPEPSMQLPELMLATFPQNTDVFKMSFGAIFNLTLWQRCANGLLGKHFFAMYITNMRNVRFLSEISSFCQQIIPTTSQLHLPIWKFFWTLYETSCQNKEMLFRWGGWVHVFRYLGRQ